jgi:pentatricopeptide repeat protein
VEIMMSEMKEQGLLPNIITYTTLVDVYGRSGRFKEAIDCIDAMKADGLKPSHTMYHALVNAYAQRVRSFYSVDFRLWLTVAHECSLPICLVP